MSEPTEKDYQKYIGDSFKELSNYITEFKKALEELAKKHEEVAEKVSNFQINQGVLAGRIYDLEEKERQRDRDEWQRELALDSGPPDYIPLGDE